MVDNCYTFDDRAKLHTHAERARAAWAPGPLDTTATPGSSQVVAPSGWQPRSMQTLAPSSHRDVSEQSNPQKQLTPCVSLFILLQ